MNNFWGLRKILAYFQVRKVKAVKSIVFCSLHILIVFFFVFSQTHHTFKQYNCDRHILHRPRHHDSYHHHRHRGRTSCVWPIPRRPFLGRRRISNSYHRRHDLGDQSAYQVVQSGEFILLVFVNHVQYSICDFGRGIYSLCQGPAIWRRPSRDALRY